MCPVDHSSASRTSTTTAPLETCSRTTPGSTSSIRLLIWRRTSAPDGLIAENSSNTVWIQYFTEYSGAPYSGSGAFAGSPRRLYSSQYSRHRAPDTDPRAGLRRPPGAASQGIRPTPPSRVRPLSRAFGAGIQKLRATTIVSPCVPPSTTSPPPRSRPGRRGSTWPRCAWISRSAPGADRVLGLLPPQLVADAPLPEGLARTLRGRRPARDRRARVGLCPLGGCRGGQGGGRAAADLLPGRGRRRVRAVAGVRQPRLAGALPVQPAGSAI